VRDDAARMAASVPGLSERQQRQLADRIAADIADIRRGDGLAEPSTG
jgi:hypothetical protein